jgi:hypothetical protein
MVFFDLSHYNPQKFVSIGFGGAIYSYDARRQY